MLVSHCAVMNQHQDFKPIRLAFGHKARVGKDTAAAYVCKKYNGQSLRFATPVYEIAGLIQQYLGKPIQKDPGLLQLIGAGLREHYTPDIWANFVQAQIRAADPMQTLCITDMRFPNEMEMLKKEGFVIVKINRHDRVIDRDPNHISEISLDNATPDYTIDNDSDIDMLTDAIDQIIRDRFPDHPLVAGAT